MKHVLDFKRRLNEGVLVYGCWLTFNDSGVAEVIGGAGFDVIMVDMEHTSISLQDLQHHLAALRRWNPVVLVRIPDHSPTVIKRVLDIGVDGIIAPMTMDAEQARRLVAACRYAPVGRRSYGPRRASNYYRDAAQYLAHVNEAIFVMPQIEHVDAADHAEHSSVLAPGDREAALTRKRRREGVPLDDQTRSQLQKAAHRHGIPFPSPKPAAAA